MAALGDWLINIMRIAVIGVIVYSICVAVGNKPVAQLAKLLAILVAVQVTYAAIAKPIQSASKKVNEIETKLDRVSNGLLGKAIWFGAPKSEVNTGAQMPQPEKSH